MYILSKAGYYINDEYCIFSDTYTSALARSKRSVKTVHFYSSSDFRSYSAVQYPFLLNMYFMDQLEGGHITFPSRLSSLSLIRVFSPVLVLLLLLTPLFPLPLSASV